MAVAQQKKQKYVDKFRIQTPKFKIKDKIWLTFFNIITAIGNKKFGAKQAKYTILDNIKFHYFRLNTPPNIQNVFHVGKLCAVSKDFVFYQVSNDNHPNPSIINNENGTYEYDVEKHWKKRVAVTNIWWNGKIMLVLFGNQRQLGKIPLFWMNLKPNWIEKGVM